MYNQSSKISAMHPVSAFDEDQNHQRRMETHGICDLIKPITTTTQNKEKV